MMNLRPFFRPSALADYIGRHTILFVAALFALSTIFALWNPLHAAEPETSDPSEITRDAAASLEAAKVKLVRDLDGLTVKEAEFTAMIDETVGSCREIRVEYIEASAGKSQAEGAVRALEEVSRDSSFAERVFDHLEAARLLAQVREVEMGEAIARAENLDGEQEDLGIRRDEVRARIREIKDAIAALDTAIQKLKLTTTPTTSPRHRVAILDPDWSYPIPPAARYREAVPAETVEIPRQIAACMSLDPDPNSTLSRVQSLGERDH